MSLLIILRNALIILLTAILAACASGPRTVSISESELQQQFSEQLSLPISLLKIFDINLTNPVIKLDGGAERLNAQIDTQVINPLSGTPLIGKINISGKLYFDISRNAVMLTESRIETLDLTDKVHGNKYSELFSVLAAKIGSELLNNIPLYTLKPEDLKVGNTYYTPRDFKIVGRDLRITLQPQ